MWRCEGYSITHHFKKLASKLLGTCDSVSAKLPGLSKQKWIWWSCVPIFKQRNCSRKTQIWKAHCQKKLGATSCSLEMWMEKLWLKHAETTKFLFCRALATEVGSPLRSQPRLTQKEAQELEKMTRPPVPQPLEYATSPLRQSNMSVEHHHVYTPRSSNKRINPSCFDCTVAEVRAWDSPALQLEKTTCSATSASFCWFHTFKHV